MNMFQSGGSGNVALHGYHIWIHLIWAASRCWCFGFPYIWCWFDHPKQTSITNLCFKNVSLVVGYRCSWKKHSLKISLKPRHFLQPLGYQLILTGHSLGAGTACCLAKILHDRFLRPNWTRNVGKGCPASPREDRLQLADRVFASVATKIKFLLYWFWK